MQSENYLYLTKFILIFSFFQFFPAFIAAQDNSSLKFDLVYTGKDPIKLDNYKVEVGDSIFMVAEGKIVVGPLAGDRNADGEPGYFGGFYNIVPNWPHCIMMAGISTQTNAISISDKEWIKCGSKFQFKAEKSGYLYFQINEKKIFSLGNRPVGRGIIIHLTIKTTKEYIGKIKNKTVSRKGNKIFWGDDEIRRDEENMIYHFAEAPNKEVGIYDEKRAPYLFDYIGTHHNTPLYFNADEGIVYFSNQLISRGDDSYWQLKDEKQKKIGIFTEEAPYFYEEIGVLDNHMVYANWQQQLVLYQNSKIKAEGSTNIWLVKDFLGDPIGLVNHNAPFVFQKIGRFPVHEDQGLQVKVYYNPQSLTLWCDQIPVQKSTDGVWYFQNTGICYEGKLFDFIGELCDNKVFKNQTQVFFNNLLIDPNQDGHWYLDKDNPGCVVNPTRPFISKK